MQEVAWEDLYDLKMKEIHEIRQEIEELKTAYKQVNPPVISTSLKRNSLSASNELPEALYSNP